MRPARRGRRHLALLSFLFVCALHVCHATAHATPVEVAVGADGALLAKESPSLLDSTTTISDTEGKNEEVPAAQVLSGDVNTASMTKVPQVNHETAEMLLLQRELAAVDEMIQLQAIKLTLLKRMRSQSLDSQVSAAPHTGISEDLERRLDAAVRAVHFESTNRRFDTYFVEQAVMELTELVVDVKIMRLSQTGTVDLIVLAHACGRLRFYLSSLREIEQLQLNGGGIQSIQLGLQDDKLCLAVLHTSGSIAVYALDITVNGLSAFKIRETDAAASQQSDTPTHRVAQYTLRLHELSSIKLLTAVTAFIMADHTGRIALGDADGTVRMFSINGTILHSLPANGPVSAIATHKQRVAFSNASRIIVADFAAQKSPTKVKCPTTRYTITSIRFDVKQREILYAGTAQGGLLVFELHFLPEIQRWSCRLKSQNSASTPSHTNGHGVRLKAVKGYVLLSGDDELAVFNASVAAQVIPKLNLVTKFKTPDHVTSPPMAFDISQGTYSSSLVLVAATGDNSQAVMLFHCLLPADVEHQDVPWLYMTYMLIPLAAVVASQFWMRRNPGGDVNPWEPSSEGFRSALGKNSSRIRQTSDRYKGGGYLGDKLSQFRDNFKDDDQYDQDDEDGADELKALFPSLSEELRQRLAHARTQE